MKAFEIPKTAFRPLSIANWLHTLRTLLVKRSSKTMNFLLPFWWWSNMHACSRLKHVRASILWIHFSLLFFSQPNWNNALSYVHNETNTRWTNVIHAGKKEIILRLNYILCWFCSISRFFFSPTSFSDFIIRLINVIIERLKYHLGLWATHESSIFAYSPRIWKTHNKNMNLNYLQTTLLM